MKNILCVKWGNKFSAGYVNKLYSMVERHLTLPHRFVCLTEDPTGLNEEIETKPLLRKDLPVLINQIASINNISDLSLTTNGYLLERLSQELVDSGLNRVTVSLDTLDQEVFKQMSGRNLDINKILTGIAAKFLDEYGCKIVGVSDVTGGIHETDRVRDQVTVSNYLLHQGSYKHHLPLPPPTRFCDP